MWAPERAIMSVWESPCFANMEVSEFRSKFGDGKLPSTREAFEIKPSRRPNSTLKFGPPACGDGNWV